MWIYEIIILATFSTYEISSTVFFFRKFVLNLFKILVFNLLTFGHMYVIILYCLILSYEVLPSLTSSTLGWHGDHHLTTNYTPTSFFFFNLGTKYSPNSLFLKLLADFWRQIYFFEKHHIVYSLTESRTFGPYCNQVEFHYTHFSLELSSGELVW